MSSFSFAKWYLGRLKDAPITTNMSSALILMVMGDISAQQLEMSYSYLRPNDDSNAAAASSSSSSEPSPPTKRLAFRRYGTMTPNVKEIKRDLARRKTKLAERHDNKPPCTNTAPASDDPNSRLRPFHLNESIYSTMLTLQSRLAAIDYFRVASMSFWATAVVTPYFVSLYKLMDRHLPHGRTVTAVGSRVVGSFVASIPLNAVFFCYGSLVHHSAEWWSLVKEWKTEVPEATISDVLDEHPFDTQVLASSTSLKLESELLTTLQASASIWIPINTFNFYFAPPHVRPLVLMFFSAFWNCYLSLAQHRDAAL